MGRAAAKGRISRGCSANWTHVWLVVFIGTFVTSIPARLLFISGLGPSWTHVRFVPGDTSTAQLKLGAFFEFGLIVTQIGTAVVIY